MTYEEIAEQWLALAQRNASNAGSNCSDILKGEGRLLCLLLENEGGMLSGHIGEATGITTGRVANLLKQLEAKGLIERGQGATDKRQTVVSLTEAGRERAEAIKQLNVTQEIEVLKTLGKENAQALLKLFGAYIDAKEQMQG